MNTRHFVAYGLRLCLVTALLALAACSSAPTSKPENPLTPIATKHRYVTPSDIGLIEIRAAVIDVSQSDGCVYTLSIGTLLPYDGSFTTETAYPNITSQGDLIAKLTHYVNDMPVGLVLTCEGEFPGTQEVPAFFTRAVSELQKTLDECGIRHTLIIPLQWTMGH